MCELREGFWKTNVWPQKSTQITFPKAKNLSFITNKKEAPSSANNIQ